MRLLTDITDIDRAQWQTLIDRSSVSSVFQTPEMFVFYSNLRLYDVQVLAIEEEGSLKGLVLCLIQGEGGRLKRRLTARAIISGGPLLADDISDAALRMLIEATIQTMKHRSIYIETRNLNDYSRWRQSFEACGFQYVPHLNFHQDTSSVKAVDSHLNRTRKRHVRVGLRDGATLEQATTEAEVAEFYRILTHLYRHKVKKPLPTQEFFLQLAHQPMAKILTVNYQGHVIGGMAYIELPGKVGYEWYVCGMDDTYKNLYPSELATYAGLRCAVQSGCPRFDYMGAGKPGESYGVRDFKAQFGGTLVEHGRFLKVNNPLIYKAGCTVISLLNHLKK